MDDQPSRVYQTSFPVSIPKMGDHLGVSCIPVTWASLSDANWYLARSNSSNMVSVVAKRNRPSAPAEFLYELEIAKRHDESMLVGVVRNRRAYSARLLPDFCAQEASARHAGWLRAR